MMLSLLGYLSLPMVRQRDSLHYPVARYHIGGTVTDHHGSNNPKFRSESGVKTVQNVHDTYQRTCSVSSTQGGVHIDLKPKVYDQREHV